MASSSSSAAIRMRNEELERQIAEMESKKSRGVSSSSAAIRLRNEQLERQLAEMDAKKSGGGALSSASAAIQMRNAELERQLAAMEDSTKSKVPGAMSSASAAIRQRNVELERQLADMESTKKMSSASVAIKLKNEQLERELAEMKKSHRSGMRLGSLDERHSLGLRSARDFPSPLSLSPSRQRMVHARETKLIQVIKESQELDLAFVVDVTGSMARFITKVKEKVPDIAASVKKQWPDLKLRVAFAPYRDYEDFDRDNQETCDFTDDFLGPESTFVKALSRINADGGGDTAEDVFSGLERVAGLAWKSRTRVLVHIGDAPCHGSEFHTGGPITDNYLNGDMKGRNIGTLLKTLWDDCRTLCYLFVHINSTLTEKMLTAFKRHAGAENWIHEEKLDSIENLSNIVVAVSTNSIAQSVRVGETGPAQIPKYVLLPVDPKVPNWDKIPSLQARQMKYKSPNSLEDLFKILATNGNLEMEEMSDLRLQIAPSPFSRDGSIRWPYHAMEHHAYKLSPRSWSGDYKTLEFASVSTVVVGSGSGAKFYNMEKYLEGTWIRYTNNLAHVNKEEYAATLHAFSHWTYDRSKGLVMVTDLQGVKGNTEKEYWLSDPAVLCKDACRYERTRTNFGEPGMKRFLLAHQCNSICRSLRLAPTMNVPIAAGTGTQLT